MSKRDANKAVTKEVLDDAAATIIKGMDNLFEDLRWEIKRNLDEIKSGQQELKVSISYLKDEVKGLKADLSDTPSRRQLHELKERVDKYHPLS